MAAEWVGEPCLPRACQADNEPPLAQMAQALLQADKQGWCHWNGPKHSESAAIPAPPVTIWTRKLIFYLDNKASPTSPILAMYGDANWFNWSSRCRAVGTAKLPGLGTWWGLRSVGGEEIGGWVLCCRGFRKGRALGSPGVWESQVPAPGRKWRRFCWALLSKGMEFGCSW